MDLVQADFVGNARVYSGESSNREFERIFGFPPQLIRDAVRMALRSYMESDDIHTQLSGPGSNLYHTLVEQVRAALDENDVWTANRSVDNHTAPRAYRRDGLGLTFAQGTNSTGNIREELHLKKRVGSVTSCRDRAVLSKWNWPLTMSRKRYWLARRRYGFWYIAAMAIRSILKCRCHPVRLMTVRLLGGINVSCLAMSA